MNNWTNTGSGKWTKSAPTGPTGMTAQFLTEPLGFMRRHSIAPPDGAASDRAGAVLGQNVLAGNEFSGGNEALHGMTIVRHKNGGIRFIKLKPRSDIKFPGSVAMEIAPANSRPARADDSKRTDKEWLPIEWLPWKSGAIFERRIPPVPTSLYDPPEDQFPRFFFTAGITGCSVFVKGEATQPTVYHAGIDGKLARGAGEFWRDQMAATGTGLAQSAIRGEVNKHEYMFRDPKESKLADDFLNWSRSNTSEKFQLEYMSPFGCVFGIRYGRHWTFYLQESVVMTRFDFVKAGEASRFVTAAGDTLQSNERYKYLQAGKIVLEKGEPSRIRKAVRYKRCFNQALPLRVSEIYPRRAWNGELRETFSQGGFARRV